MKMKFRRILALTMTVVLVVTTIIFTAGNTLKAEGEDPAEVALPVTEQETEPAPEPEPAEPATDKQELAVGDDNASVGDEEAVTEEPTEPTEPTEATEEEVNMPAQSFSQTAGNGIRVSVSAPEGAFPEGTTMTVSAVSRAKAMSLVEDAVENAEDAKGVDITFHYKGKEIQPEKNISVKLGNAKVKGDDFSVYHVDGGAVEKVTNNATSNGATFKTDEFSVYIMVGKDRTYRVSYNLKGGDGSYSPPVDNNEYNTGDVATVKGIPGYVKPPAGKSFIGWTLSANGKGDAYFEGDTIIIGSSDITFWAQWGDKPRTTTVTYKTNYPDGAVDSDGAKLKDKSVRLKAEVDNGNVIVSSLADVDFKTPRGYKFVGWEEDNGKIYQPGGLFKVNVNNENKNVFKAKWAEDPDQTKTLKYTVEHKIGNTLKHSQDYTKDVWVNDPDRLTIRRRKP